MDHSDGGRSGDETAFHSELGGATWGIDLVIADLASLSAASLAMLSQKNSPKLLAVVGDDDAEAGGIAMSTDLAGFIGRGASSHEYLDAVEMALGRARSPRNMSDISDNGMAQITALSVEVGRIMTALATLAAGERRMTSGGPLPVTAVQVRAIIKARRLRDQFFPAELFGDPVWDMLLDLTAARLEMKPVSVSSLCLAASVPTTTGLRQIKTLCEAGMFIRRTDPLDARRTFIELSESSVTGMTEYLSSLRGSGPVV